MRIHSPDPDPYSDYGSTQAIKKNQEELRTKQADSFYSRPNEHCDKALQVRYKEKFLRGTGKRGMERAEPINKNQQVSSNIQKCYKNPSQLRQRGGTPYKIANELHQMDGRPRAGS